MFEVGKAYSLHILEDEVGQVAAGITEYGWAYEAPMLKIAQGDDVTIYNVSSPRFIRAELLKGQ